MSHSTNKKGNIRVKRKISFSYSMKVPTPFRKSSSIFILLLILSLILPLSLIFTVNAEITGPELWNSGEGSTSPENTFMTAIIAENGTVLTYVEVVPSAGIFRLRDNDGTNVEEFVEMSLRDCRDPTGASILNNGDRILLFCGSDQAYFDIELPSPSDILRAERITTEEVFYPSSEPHPTPIIVPRAVSMDFREDAIFAVSSNIPVYCIGRYGLVESAIVCQTTKITDFYLSTWVTPTDEEPDPKTYLITESLQGSGLQINTYYLPTFSNNVEPNASGTLAFDDASKVIHTNINDDDGALPLIAYTQASVTDTLKIALYVVNAHTLEVVKNGVIETGVQVRGISLVTSAYMVNSGNNKLLMVQTPELLAAIDYNSLPDVLSPLWTVQTNTAPGLIFEPLRNLYGNIGEWYRRQGSPSYTDYNPYHTIQATTVSAMTTMSNFSTYTLTDGSVSSEIGPLWNNGQFCQNNDHLSAITAFDSSLVYVGCSVSGNYVLIDLSNNKPYYSISWPTVYSNPSAPFAYSSGSGYLTLSNGTNAVGVGLNPLLLYSQSVLKEQREIPVAAYDRGRISLLTPTTSGSNGSVTFSYYVHDRFSTDGGREPMSTSVDPTTLQREVISAQPFTAFFGDGKRYIAVSSTPGTLSIFAADNGASVTELNISECIGNSAAPGAGTVTFMNTIQHFGTFSNYYVVVGGTSSCLFEVNDTLVPRISLYQAAEQGVIIGTTSYSGYKYTTSSKTIQAFTSFFDGQPTSVYTEANIDAYVVGSNVFVYLKGNTLTCRSVRSDITVWTQALPETYQPPLLHMSYYNNTVYIVDQHGFYRINVQYRENDDGSTRVLRRATVPDTSISILGAAVGQGVVVLFSSSMLYEFDAVTGSLLWNKRPLSTQLPAGASFEMVLYSPEDTGGSLNDNNGTSYIEIRIIPAEGRNNRLINIYRQDNGDALTSVSRSPSDFTGPTIWGNKYVTFSANNVGGLASFRAINLPNVTIPSQAKRPQNSTLDVYVPGEEPIIPVHPAIPRGDDIMAGSPPMSFSLTGRAALISPDRSTAVFGTIESGETNQYRIRCVRVNDPQGNPIRDWILSSGISIPSVRFLEINNNAFMLFTTTTLQSYSWSTCEEIGLSYRLGGVTNGLPPYINRGDQDRWIFLNSEQVIAYQPSTGRPNWETTVGNCKTIRLQGNYIICDGGTSVALINLADGSTAFTDPVAACIASAGNNFAGVARSARGYDAVFYSTSAKLFTANLNIPGSAGQVVAAIPGKSNTNILVFFENLVASVTFDTVGSTATVDWTNDLNGENPQIGGARYIGAGNPNIFIGTRNGFVLADPSNGKGFLNVSLRKRYIEDANEVQTLRIISVTGDTQYGVMWNGYVTLLNIGSLSGSASFAFGFGISPASQLSISQTFLLIGCGTSAGIVPLSLTYWGASVKFAALATGSPSNSEGIFLAGWDQRNSTSVNLVSVTRQGQVATRNVPGETNITDSLSSGRIVTFFGERTISSIGDLVGSGMSYNIPSTCAGNKLKAFYRNDVSGGFSVVWYTGGSRDCIFLISQQGSPPSMMGTLTGPYQGIANMRYGNSLGVLSTNQLAVWNYDGTSGASVSITSGTYISSLSSPDTGEGIFVVISQGSRVDCYQVRDLVHVWNYTLSRTSSAPVTYYNNSVFISTETGPYRLDLSEYTYPCPDRNLLFVERPIASGRTTEHSSVVVNEEYGIGFVTTGQIFYAFDVYTGVILWERPDLYFVPYAEVIYNGTVLFVSSTTSGMVFLNPFTGISLLSFPNVEGGNSRIYRALDGLRLGLGGSIATVFDYTSYSSYLGGVRPNRPKLPTPPPYRSYNYNPRDRPNECSEPDADGTPIMEVTPQEWVSGVPYGMRNPSVVGISFASGQTSGWVALLAAPALYISRATEGTFASGTFGIVNPRGCDNINVFAASVDRVIVAVRCGNNTIYYNSSGHREGESTRVASNSFSIVVRGNGYYLNAQNYIEGISLTDLRTFSGGAQSPRCTATFDMVALPTAERIMFFCKDVGIRSLQYSTLLQLGQAVTAGVGFTDFTSYDMDEALNLGVACGNVGSTIYMVSFEISTMKIKLTRNLTATGPPLCGIRYPLYPNTETSLFVLAYQNGYDTWNTNGNETIQTQSIQNAKPAAISSNGLVYYNVGGDYYFRPFGGERSILIAEALGASTGHTIVRAADGNKATSNVFISGQYFNFAVDTSSSNLRPLWSGRGNILLSSSARPVSVYPYVYTTGQDNSFICFMTQNISFAIQGYTQMTTAVVDGKQVAFISQAGTIGSVDSLGNILWNVGFSNNGNIRFPFKPIVIDSLDYILASGGARSAVIVNKHTGAIASAFQLSTCNTAPDAADAKVFVNGTFVYITLSGWSCTHIFNLNVVNNSGIVVVPPVVVLEPQGTTTGITTGYPIWTRVGLSNHLVYATNTPSTNGQNQTFSVYRIDDVSTSNWVRLWSTSIRAETDKVSTYGNFIYIGVGPNLNVYDLLTGRYVWGYIFDEIIMAPAIGADLVVYVWTRTAVQSLRASLNIPWSLRRMGNVSLPNIMIPAANRALGPIRTPYGQILISNDLGAMAFRHQREGTTLAPQWVAEKSLTRFAFAYLSENTSIGLFDNPSGTGYVDLTTGYLKWFSGVPPAGPQTNGVYLPNSPFFVCSFVSEETTCRLVPVGLLQPQNPMPLYYYDPEPTETTPSDWTPIYPGGGGSRPLHPDPRCLSLMHSYIPPFTNCINNAISRIYPNGRATPLTCPDNFYPIRLCQANLNPLAQSCLDVGAYLMQHWAAQTRDITSPLGVCDTSEATRRCIQNSSTILTDTCRTVTLTFTLNGYENPIGYEINFPLPVFTFPQPPQPSKMGLIVGVVVAVVVVVVIVVGVGIYFMRKKKKERDARFFEDPLLGKNSGADEAMSNLSRGYSSKESSIDIGGVSNHNNNYNTTNNNNNNSREVEEPPKKTPAKAPMKLPVKMAGKKGLRPKLPPVTSGNNNNVNASIINGDDL